MSLPGCTRRRKIRAAQAKPAQSPEWSGPASYIHDTGNRLGKPRACRQPSPWHQYRNSGNLRRRTFVEFACVWPKCTGSLTRNERRASGLLSRWRFSTSVVALMAITLRERSEFFDPPAGAIDEKTFTGGWIMVRISRSMVGAKARGNLNRMALQFCAVVVVVFAMNFVISLGAAPSQLGPAYAPELTSQAGRIDRSLKGDRINTVAPTVRPVLPPGCEPPFSTLVKPLRSDPVVRCMT
jgi:hypothetical protein